MSDIYEMVDQITEEVIKELFKRGKISIESQEQTPEINSTDLASMIDHTPLKPDAGKEEINSLCREALQYGFASVCVNPFWVKEAAQILRGSDVKTCAVVGFPLGASPSDIKAYEARRAILDGAREIDMVINIGALKDGDNSFVERDIRMVAQVAEEYGVLLKVIIETCLGTKDEKVSACMLAMRAGAEYVKTSTGFSSGGATVEDVKLIKDVVGDKLKVKASGGIRTYESAMAMIRAGA